VNCGGFYPSAGRKFPVFVDEKEMQEVKVKEGAAFPEAGSDFYNSNL
jgi:hypothetical protein